MTESGRPRRDVFHISEFRAFSHLVITYWIKKGMFEPARVLFEALEEIDPDGEQTHLLRGAIRGSYLLEAARKLSARMLGSGRLPGR